MCKGSSKSSQKTHADENLAEEVAMLTYQFTKFKNKFYKKAGGNGTQINKDNNNSNFSNSRSSNSSTPFKRHEYDQRNLQELRKLTGVSNVTNVKDMDISK